VVTDTTESTRGQRLRKAFRENLRYAVPRRPFKLDAFEFTAVIGYLGLVALLTALLSYDGVIGGVPSPWNWLVLLSVSVFSGPLVIACLLAVGMVGASLLDFVIDETEGGRRQRESIRRALRDVRKSRRALGKGLDGVKPASAVYSYVSEMEPSGGPWSCWLAYRLRRVRRRLATRIEGVYTSSLAAAIAALGPVPSPRDETVVVWRRPPLIRSIASQRLLAEFSDSPVSALAPARPSVLVYTPRWVFDLVSADAYTRQDEMLFYPGMRRPHPRVEPSVAVALDGAQRETVDKLFEPYGSGPMSDLVEVVRAALLLD